MTDLADAPLSTIRRNDPTPPGENVERAFARLRAADRRDGGLPVDERQRLLRVLDRTLVARADRLDAALNADFGRRSTEETLLAEIMVVANAARRARRHVRRWSRPKAVRVDGPFWPARAWVVPQPLGVVGILSPWNYPINLSLAPLIGALAAGNRVLLKPSELTPRTAAELASLLEDTLGPDIAQTVQGGPETAGAVTRLPLDHLLFTGSARHGALVMRAAADHLTPLTLELGGKCPALILADADLDAAARWLVLGKALNAGQTCIAPDTVLLVGVPAGDLEAALRRAWRRHYPDGLATALHPRAPAERLDELATGATLTRLGEPGDTLTLALDPSPSSPLHDEEIFGPMLPVVTMPDLDTALAWIAERPHPLAVYLFTRNRRQEALVLKRTRAGALVVNGTIIQAAVDALPFGGVGGSGFGRYHGRAGFDTFSNPRAHLRAPRWSLARLCDPPFNPAKRRLIDRLLGR